MNPVSFPSVSVSNPVSQVKSVKRDLPNGHKKLDDLNAKDFASRPIDQQATIFAKLSDADKHDLFAQLSDHDKSYLYNNSKWDVKDKILSLVTPGTKDFLLKHNKWNQANDTFTEEQTFLA
ncbi:MAG: hypothetical protein HY606_02175 [Planctomycetes bacterium]|nr:hypothetical protein [Planctomycetota bacterium]